MWAGCGVQAVGSESQAFDRAAVAEMLDRTEHPAAPWVLVEAEDKRWARVKVAESVVAAIEAGMAARNIGVPAEPSAGGIRRTG